MSIENQNSEFVQENAHQELQIPNINNKEKEVEIKREVKEGEEREREKEIRFEQLGAKQRRNHRYTEAARFFQKFDELNLAYQEALQIGDGEKVAKIIALMQQKDLRAEGERLQKEADELYVQEKASEDMRLQSHVKRIRSAMHSIQNQQAA